MITRLIFLLLINIQAILGPHVAPERGTHDQEGCCNTQPVVYCYNQQLVSIPPVFTPNGDGYNDRFLPKSEDQTLIIRDFTILSARGDSLLFFKARIDYSDGKHLVDCAWNGQRADGTRYEGLFIYRLTVGDQPARPNQLAGKACALRCRSGGRVLQSKAGCFYAD